MWRYVFFYVALIGRIANRPANISRRDMIPVPDSRSWVHASCFRRKQILPFCLFRGIWIFNGKCFWQDRFTESFFQIALMKLFNFLNMIFEIRSDGVGQYGYTISSSFAVSYNDLPVSKIDIQHPESQRFRNSQAGSVEQTDDQFMQSIQMCDHSQSFRFSQDDRHMARSFCTFQLVEIFEWFFKNMFI